MCAWGNDIEYHEYIMRINIMNNNALGMDRQMEGWTYKPQMILKHAYYPRFMFGDK